MHRSALRARARTRSALGLEKCTLFAELDVYIIQKYVQQPYSNPYQSISPARGRLLKLAVAPRRAGQNYGQRLGRPPQTVYRGSCARQHCNVGFCRRPQDHGPRPPVKADRPTVPRSSGGNRRQSVWLGPTAGGLPAVTPGTPAGSPPPSAPGHSTTTPACLPHAPSKLLRAQPGAPAGSSVCPPGLPPNHGLLCRSPRPFSLSRVRPPAPSVSRLCPPTAAQSPEGWTIISLANPCGAPSATAGVRAGIVGSPRAAG